MRARVTFVMFAVMAALHPGCGCSGGKVKQPYPTPTLETFLAHVRSQGEKAKTYVAASNTMDYWVGKERIKATVHVMGERGAKIRFNAINPATGTTAADLACDGAGFLFIDYEQECHLIGVCDRGAIAQLLRVSLEPDDFLLLAVGTTPLIPDPTGKVTWNSDNGTWVIELVSRDRQWRQKIVLDGDDKDGGVWEVVESVVTDAKGVVDWQLVNKKFETITSDDGEAFRLPLKSRFQQPREKADLIVDWAEGRMINLPIDPAKFKATLPAGLKMCGQKNAPAAQPPPVQPGTP